MTDGTFCYSERLAQTQLSVEEDPNLTFAPAVNDRSMRLAISKELRAVREDLPLADRLTSRQPLKLNPGQSHISFTDWLMHVKWHVTWHCFGYGWMGHVSLLPGLLQSTRHHVSSGCKYCVYAGDVRIPCPCVVPHNVSCLRSQHGAKNMMARVTVFS